MFDAGNRDNIDYAIARFLYASDIPFNVAQSPYYEEMVRVINNGPKGYKPLGYEKLCTNLIDNEKSRVEKELEPVRDEWPKDGCSIIMDGWTDRRNRPLLYIMVSCSRGLYFMRAIDCSLKEKNDIFQLDLLYFNKFSWIALIIEKGREIQMFVCNHHQTQAIYRFHVKVELLKPANTRYGTYFILLHRLLEVRGALSAMVIGEMWTDWRQSSSDAAIQVRRMILDD
eukprot:Gb_18465 [translate_table: standard]